MNLKDTSYPSQVNLLSDNKLPCNPVDLSNLELPVKKLKGCLTAKIGEIENKVQNELLDLKAKINSEFQAIEEIMEKIKSFEK